MTALVWLSGRMRSGAVFLGTLYLVLLVVLAPLMWSGLSHHLGRTLGTLFLLILPIFIVEVFMNGALWLVSVTPWLVGMVLLIGGQLIWLAAPLPFVLIGLLSAMPTIGAAVTTVTPLMELFVEHLGLTISALGGGLLWAAKRLRNLDQVALTTYLAALSLMGIFWGATNLAPLVVFLILWLMLYAKLHDNPTMGTDIRRLFQVAATAAVAGNVVMAPIIHQWAVIVQHAIPSFSLSSSNLSGTPFHASTVTFSGLWAWSLRVGLLLGIWKPQSLWKALPSSARDPLAHWLKLVTSGIVFPGGKDTVS